MKEIKLTQGFVALIDDEDYELVSMYKWRILRGRRAIYAFTEVYNKNRSKGIYMHRLIMGINETNVHIDHINMNGLDNRKLNLRPCNHSQNLANSYPKKNTSSKYKGVSRFKDKWASDVRFNGKTIHLGIYDKEEDAAMAYDNKARILFGEFCRPNFDYSYDVQKNMSTSEKKRLRESTLLGYC